MRDRSDAGLRAVIAYKLVRGAASVALAALLGAVLVSGAPIPVHQLAAVLDRHVTAAWAVEASRLLEMAAAPRTLELTILALGLDGVLTLAEGWALHRRFAWAPWAVVVSTGSLLPFEGVELMRRPGLARLTILLVNLAIVVSLAARARREKS
jgi:uncharacterized membrane protein (DUF2068 family)